MASQPRRAALRPDVVGRVGMITVLTALMPLDALRLRVLFALTRRFPQLGGLGPLKSVYFTRWSVLTSLPYNGPPQVPERLGHGRLLWETVYSAPTEPYVEAFVHGVGSKVRRIWRRSYGFPGTGSVTALAGYIGELAIPGAHNWAAYPTATVRTVLAALDVAREHRYLVQAARTASPEEFAVLYRGFLDRRKGDL
ncbi:hypothetical protein ACU610_25265 [Geodermatophilus sp. URMC 61]|uniref:hypothetical protein n=1 Tax=Geodermatophilus sp. URMC 61 TaxID=3423411 RepID=UPI00406D4CD7